MLKIRLHRTGKTKRPHYRVVIAEHTKAAQGPYVASLGTWDPLKGHLLLNKEDLAKWLERGVKPSDRVARILHKEGIKHKHIVIHQRPARGPKKAEPKVEEPKVEKPLAADVEVTEAEAPESPETVVQTESPTTEPVEKPSEPVEDEENVVKPDKEEVK